MIRLLRLSRWIASSALFQAGIICQPTEAKSHLLASSMEASWLANDYIIVSSRGRNLHETKRPAGCDLSHQVVHKAEFEQDSTV